MLEFKQVNSIKIFSRLYESTLRQLICLCEKLKNTLIVSTKHHKIFNIKNIIENIVFLNIFKSKLFSKRS